jgi:glycosyltransferase involved in cell wall biosynthesis
MSVQISDRPLKVFQVATGFSDWGGSEKHILDLTQSLLARGHEVKVLVRPGCWVEKRAGELGLTTIPVTILKQKDWQDYGRLREILRAEKPDVLHVHCNSDLVVPGLAALMERVPARIITRHLPFPFQNLLGAKLYSEVLFSRIVTVSEFVRKNVIACGVSPGKVMTIHHGTDVEAFCKTTKSREEMRREFGVSPETIAIGIAGRISKEKGHDVLLRAMKSLVGKHDVKLIVIGNGPYNDDAQALVKELGIEDRVLFTGFRNDVANAVDALDIVAVPSVWDEACSAAIQQGMALSKPIVGTTTGGSPEMILDGETGYVLPPSDSDALASALAKLIVDPDLRARMGAAGKSRVAAGFTLGGMTDKLVALYRQYGRPAPAQPENVSAAAK